MTNYRRRHYLTEKKYQIRYTLVILLAMLLVAFIIGGLTYWDLSSNLGKERALELMRWDAYIFRVAILLLAAFLSGIFLSHKIIGPIRRIENALRDMNEGQYDVNLKLRFGDELYGISEEINKLGEKLKKFNN